MSRKVKQSTLFRRQKVQKIAEMMKRGLNYDQIAQEMNCPRAYIYNWTADARRLAFPEPPKPVAAPEAKTPEPVKRRIGPPDALPIGHHVPTDALWAGLERYRPQTGPHAPRASGDGE